MNHVIKYCLEAISPNSSAQLAFLCNFYIIYVRSALYFFSPKKSHCLNET